VRGDLGQNGRESNSLHGIQRRQDRLVHGGHRFVEPVSEGDTGRSRVDAFAARAGGLDSALEIGAVDLLDSAIASGFRRDAGDESTPTL
jgi:hypothetical protein